MKIEKFVEGLQDLISEAKHLPAHIILANIEMVTSNLTKTIWEDAPEDGRNDD